MATHDDTARRQHGTGSLFWRESTQRWVGQVEAGWTAKGKRRFRTVSDPDKAKCKQKLRELVLDVATEQGPRVSQRVTVKRWCDQWMERYAATARPRTVATDCGNVRRWIIPTLGRLRVSDLTPADLDRLADVMRKAGKSPTTVHNVAALLRRILKAAVVAGVKVPAPVMAAPLPAVGVNRRQAIPVADCSAILQTATHPETWPELPPRPPHADTRGIERWYGERILRETDASRWMAVLLQGLRQGEALGLTWECVDLRRDVLDVSWQLQRIPRDAETPPDYEVERLDGTACLVRPKSRAGMRTIPIVPWMAAALADWQERQTDSLHGLVWPQITGAPMIKSRDLSAWKALQRIAGVSKTGGVEFVGHEGRHAVASLLTQLEIPEPVILAIVGHSTFASTLRYTHVVDAQARKALQQVADRLQITD